MTAPIPTTTNAMQVTQRDRVMPVDPGRIFRGSLLISAIRCTLSYVVFPFALPLIGMSAGLDSKVGLVLGPIAIAANAFAIHRFWSVDHKFKRPAAVVHLVMILALVVLLVGDTRIVLFGTMR